MASDHLSPTVPVLEPDNALHGLSLSLSLSLSPVFISIIKKQKASMFALMGPLLEIVCGVYYVGVLSNTGPLQRTNLPSQAPLIQ